MTQVPRPRTSAESSGQSARISAVAVDTGPLLCFGAVTGGPRLFISRYKGRLHWAEAVANEIRHQAQRGGTSALEKRQQSAAQRWVGTSAGQLGEPQVFTDRSEVDAMRGQVQAASTRPAKDGHDLGESETLLLAQRRSAMALINENAARTVARRLRLRTHCALDVLVASYQDGHLELRDVQKMYEQLREAGLDAGDVLPSPCKGRALDQWRAPAPA